MVDRYTKIVLTVIAVMLTGLVVRPLLEAPTAVAQPAVTPAACGAPENPCAVSIVGGPVVGAWQGAPLFVFDAQAETRAQAQQPCGRVGDPCYAVVVGGPDAGWRGWPLVILDSLRLAPRRTQ